MWDQYAVARWQVLGTPAVMDTGDCNSAGRSRHTRCNGISLCRRLWLRGPTVRCCTALPVSPRRGRSPFIPSETCTERSRTWTRSGLHEPQLWRIGASGTCVNTCVNTCTCVVIARLRGQGVVCVWVRGFASPDCCQCEIDVGHVPGSGRLQCQCQAGEAGFPQR